MATVRVCPAARNGLTHLYTPQDATAEIAANARVLQMEMHCAEPTRIRGAIRCRLGLMKKKFNFISHRGLFVLISNKTDERDLL